MKMDLKNVDWLRAGLIAVILLDVGLAWFAYVSSQEDANAAFGEAAPPPLQIGDEGGAGIFSLPAPTPEEVAMRVAEAQGVLQNWDPFKSPTARLAQQATSGAGEGIRPVIDVTPFTIRALLTFGRDRYVLIETKGRAGLVSYAVGGRLEEDTSVVVKEITRAGILLEAPDREPTWLTTPKSTLGGGSNWFGRSLGGDTRGSPIQLQGP